MSISTPRLLKSRHGTYYFRLLVPPALVSAVGKREVRTSLHTKDASTARVRALQLSIIFEHSKQHATSSGSLMKHLLDQLAHHARAFTVTKNGTTISIESEADLALYQKAVAAGLATPLTELFKAPANAHPPSALTMSTEDIRGDAALPMTLKDALEGYVGANPAVAKKTKAGRARTVQYLIEYLADHDNEKKNRDWYAHEVKSRHIHRFLAWYPSRPGKTGRPSRQSDQGSLSASTHMTILGSVKDFFAYCGRENAIDPKLNPVSDDLFSEVKRARRNVSTRKQRYQPFTAPEIMRIFDPVTYLKATTADAEFFWSPLLAAFTGARQGEIAQLTLGKIQREEASGVYFLVIDDRVKTENSIRNIPISECIIELGFLRYVDHVRTTASGISGHEIDKVPLFPMQTRGATFETNPGKRVSDFFARYLDSDAVKIIDPLKVFHSFRHTVVSILNTRGVPEGDIQLVVGHAAQDGHIRRDVGRQFQSVTKRYTHHNVEGLHTDTLLARLSNHINEHVRLPLDFNRLKAIADIVQEQLRWDSKQKRWKSGWHTNAQDVTEAMVMRLQQVAPTAEIAHS